MRNAARAMRWMPLVFALGLVVGTAMIAQACCGCPYANCAGLSVNCNKNTCYGVACGCVSSCTSCALVCVNHSGWPCGGTKNCKTGGGCGGGNCTCGAICKAQSCPYGPSKNCADATAWVGCDGEGCSCGTFCVGVGYPCGGSVHCSNQTYGCRKKGPDFKNCACTSGYACASFGDRHDGLICKLWTPTCDNGTWCCGGCAGSGRVYTGCTSPEPGTGSCETVGHCRCGPCSCEAGGSQCTCQSGQGVCQGAGGCPTCSYHQSSCPGAVACRG